MTRFILPEHRDELARGNWSNNPFFGAQVTPYEMAQFTNAVQEIVRIYASRHPGDSSSRTRAITSKKAGWVGLDASVRRILRPGLKKQD